MKGEQEVTRNSETEEKKIREMKRNEIRDYTRHDRKDKL